ncbi:helix-turn-helix domain-containing protein [Corynebacterium pilosum]|uniref:helix-turn-helix domain-containing protein n=1 Tax=Corynebacterium pilosum TaxID=35756 RepID=UPI00128BC1D6
MEKTMSISTSKRHRDWLVEPTRITNARLRRGLTKTELARNLDVTTRTVARYEEDGARQMWRHVSHRRCHSQKTTSSSSRQLVLSGKI